MEHKPAIPALSRRRQEDHQSQTSLGYILRTSFKLNRTVTKICLFQSQNIVFLKALHLSGPGGSLL
jgi:hypothetical protein